MPASTLGVLAALWGLVMAVAPLLQIRQMWLRRSSRNVSLGYFAVLLPGFALWIAYGLARADWALVVPNAVALLVSTTTVVIAACLRSREPRPLA
ncbi:SemiSWEET family sugar transporter [Phytohabitans rumicis]|uniref:Sugar transporter SemiSWEET n=1 Tax=Phytohabitans rumicis TaxID=1076125 RepID=A0A6V8L9B5_9ACTN|nr:SemiSWEET family transporter [Phytohabitans rumicis]GFJ91159.1 hypothetical protein Prum_048010 [Phytohabitans rumicis]